jgi:hypothetical protein
MQPFQGLVYLWEHRLAGSERRLSLHLIGA